MINDIRNLVHFILNKESRGYITPLEFNTFAKQAQQEIVDGYFHRHNRASVVRESRINEKEILKKTKENLDKFIVAPTSLTYNNGVFEEPNDLYVTINLLYNSKEIESIGRDKLWFLLESNLTAPSLLYPAYVKYDGTYKVYPDTIEDGVELVYFRLPKDPNWTYFMVDEDAVFNPSDPNYQDFEIGYDDKMEIAMRILKYAGLNIREQDIVVAAKAIEEHEMITNRTQ
jgi:hypothetical protein